MKAEILVGPERRRRWSAEEKARIVAEATMPGATVADIARRHGVSRGLIYTWRRKANQEVSREGLASTLPELVPVVVRDSSREATSPEVVRQNRRACSTEAVKPDGAIEIALPGDVRMTVRGHVAECTLRAVLGALRSA